MGTVRVLGADGAPVEVDENEAAAGLADGRYRVGGGRVRLRLADGGVAEVDAERVGSALADTSTFVGLDTPEHARERDLQRTYGDSPLAAGAAGLARGATLGVSDVIGGAVGGAEALRELEARNPEASIGGEIVGSVAPVLLSGGAGAAGEVGLLGRAARAVGAPTRVLAGLSEGAGAAAGRAITGTGASVGRRLLGRAAGTAVEGAIEGAAGEAAHLLSEEALGSGDPELTAQQVIARLGYGALLGGAAGGLLGGGLGIGREALRGTARLGRESVDVIRRSWSAQHGTELQPGVAQMLADAYGRSAAVVSGSDPGAARLFTGLSEEGRAARRIVDEGPEATYGRGTRELGTSLDRAFRAIDPVLDEAIGARKIDDVARVVRTDAFADQLRVAETHLEQVRRLADDISTNQTTYGDGAMAARARMLRAASEAESRILAAMDETDAARRAARLHGELDQLKRLTGRARDRYVRTRYAREAVDDLYRGMQTSLEDQQLWGEGIRGVQADTNAAWHRFLNWDGDVERMFAREGESIGFDRVRASDSAKLSSFLQQIGTAANDSRAQVFGDWLRGAGDLTSTIGRHYDLTPEATRALSEFQDAIASVRRIYDDTANRATVLNQWTRLSGGSNGSALAASLGGGGAAAMALGGGAIGAPLALAGAGLGALSSPARTARLLTAVERIARQTDGEVGESVRRFLGGASSRTRNVARRTRRAAVLGTVRAYEERVRQLDEQTRDERATAERMAASTADLTRDAPQVQQAMQVAGGRALGVLRSARPRGRLTPGDLFQQTANQRPSHEEMERFLRVARVIDDPMTVLRDLESRRLTAESVDTLRAVYPALYNEIVRRTQEEIANASSPPSYQDRLQLGLLLGIPTDPSLVPENLAILQMAHAPTSTPPQTSTASTQDPPNLAGSMASGTQRLEARR